jgi:hypothetical protein
MPLQWPSFRSEGGNLPKELRAPITTALNSVADLVQSLLAARGLSRNVSPIFRPWSLYVFVTSDNVFAIFCPHVGGSQNLIWNDLGARSPSQGDLFSIIEDQTQDIPATCIILPKSVITGPITNAEVASIASQYVDEVEGSQSLARLGDITGLENQLPALMSFLSDHPNFEKNVFIMMRFDETDQMKAIHSAIIAALADRGFHAVRADDRNYTDELWSNIQICAAGCKFGISVFEDIDHRDFNPNVSLELGYMLGRNKRCLILKEQRLEQLPTDVIHRLYKPFDAFNIEASVRSQVLEWIDTDLGSNS